MPSLRCAGACPCSAHARGSGAAAWQEPRGQPAALPKEVFLPAVTDLALFYANCPALLLTTLPACAATATRRDATSATRRCFWRWLAPWDCQWGRQLRRLGMCWQLPRRVSQAMEWQWQLAH